MLIKGIVGMYLAGRLCSSCLFVQMMIFMIFIIVIIVVTLHLS